MNERCLTLDSQGKALSSRDHVVRMGRLTEWLNALII